MPGPNQDHNAQAPEPHTSISHNQSPAITAVAAAGQSYARIRTISSPLSTPVSTTNIINSAGNMTISEICERIKANLSFYHNHDDHHPSSSTPTSYSIITHRQTHTQPSSPSSSSNPPSTTQKIPLIQALATRKKRKPLPGTSYMMKSTHSHPNSHTNTDTYSTTLPKWSPLSVEAVSGWHQTTEEALRGLLARTEEMIGEWILFEGEGIEGGIACLGMEVLEDGVVAS